MQLRSPRPLFSLAALAALALPSLSQTATLHDGTVLTRSVADAPFVVEGPLNELNLAGRTLSTMGKTIQIPATLNGQPFVLTGLAVTNADGTPAGGIGAGNFDRLADANALGRDTHALFAGATRSVFSSVENARTDATAPQSRNPAAEAAARANYFAHLQACYPYHAAVLPPLFLDLAGIRGVDSTTWSYPLMSGSSLLATGQTYLDALGRTYLIPDAGANLGMAEHVVSGPIRSLHAGGPGVPPSFVIGNMLVVMNQDPRFDARVLSLSGAALPRSLFFQNGLGRDVTLAGYAVGDHVYYATDVDTTLTDPTAPIVVTATNWLFKNTGNEIRFNGTIDQAAGIALQVKIGTRVWNIALVVDPVTGSATYDFRSKGEVNVATVAAVTIEARRTNTVVATAPAFTQTFLRAQLP